jgi:hypothetical protein
MSIDPILKDATTSDNLAYFLEREAKDITSDIIPWNEWRFKYPSASAAWEEALRLKYRFPSPEKPWEYCTFEQMCDQMLNASKMIDEYINLHKLVPLQDKENSWMLQRSISAPLLSSGGEILDETFGKPTITRSQINLFCSDRILYSWKIANKKTSSGDMPAVTTESIENQCVAISHHLGKDIDFPIGVVLLKAIVNKKGEKVKLEEHHRWVSEDEVESAKRRLAVKARDIKNMNLFTEKSYACKTSCEFFQICICNKSDDYVVNSWDDYIPQKDEEDDGTPF